MAAFACPGVNAGCTACSAVQTTEQALQTGLPLCAHIEGSCLSPARRPPTPGGSCTSSDSEQPEASCEPTGHRWPVLGQVSCGAWPAVRVRSDVEAERHRSTLFGR